MIELWNQAQEQVRTLVGEEIFAEAIEGLRPVQQIANVLHLSSSDELQVRTVEEKYASLIEACVSDVAGMTMHVEVSFVVAPAQSVDPQLALFPQELAPVGPSFSGGLDLSQGAMAARELRGELLPGMEELSAPLMPSQMNTPVYGSVAGRSPEEFAQAMKAAELDFNLSFQNFVAEGDNFEAVELSRCFISGELSSMGAMVILGDSGMGKTHLLHAIGQEVLKSFGAKRVRYIKEHELVDLFSNGFRAKNSAGVRHALLEEADVLLIDGLSEFARLDRTQKEFAKLLSTFSSGGRQVVIATNTSPFALEGLQREVRAQLSCALTVELDMPDVHVRREIAQRTCLRLSLPLGAEVLSMLGQRAFANVSALVSATQHLGARARIRRGGLGVEQATDVLDRSFPVQSRRVTPQEILKAVCARYDVREQEIFNKGRVKRIAVPRKVAMYLCRTHTELSYPDLGRFFGGRDHSTVLSAFRAIEKDISKKPDIARDVDAIQRVLGLR